MIDIGAARAWLAGAAAGVTGVEVLPRGVVGTFTPPVAVIGQPDVQFDTEHMCGTDETTFPIAVVVRHHPGGPAATQAELEELWPQVAARLRDHLDSDPSMGGICSAAELTDSTFGELQVQGQAYPAQALTVTIHGG